MTIKTASTRLAALFLAALLAGCDSSNTSGRSAPGPTIGAACHVYFRHDALGAAQGSPGSALTDSINGAEVSVSGTLRRMDADWVVVTTPGEYFDSDVWVPRGMVLAIKVLGPPKPKKP